MRIVNKTFVQKIYLDGEKYKYTFKRVEDRNPENIINDGKMEGFRFFSRAIYFGTGSPENETFGKLSDFSPTIYYGERYSLEEIKYSFKHKSRLVLKMKEEGVKDICFTQTGNFLPLTEKDLTYKEYIENKENLDNIFTRKRK